MLSRDIISYSKLRYEIRAYIVFVFEQNIKNFMPNTTIKQVQSALERISNEIKAFDALYILSPGGLLVNKTIYNITEEKKKTLNNFEDDSTNNDFSNRAYYYETLKEKRSILTDPYPSKVGGKLVVTASYPIYNSYGDLICIACVDISLQKALNLTSPSLFYDYFSKFSVVVYSALSFMLSLVALLLLIKGAASLLAAMKHFHSLDIKEVFESTILLTLSLAIFDLVKAIFEEEVLGKNTNESNKAVHKTMTRFLGSIIIAIAIEALMLVFKFTITQPDKLLYAVYLTGAVSMLLVGLSIYVKFAYAANSAQRLTKKTR